jgi:hypothetical protein
MALFDSGFFNSPANYLAGGFDTLMNSGAPTVAGSSYQSPLGELLDNYASVLRGGLLGNYGGGGLPGDAPQSAAAPSAMPAQQFAATASPPQPANLPSWMPPGGSWFGSIGAWPSPAPQLGLPTAPAPTQPSAAPRPPLSLHPDLPQSAAPQGQGGGVFGELGDWIGNNRWALMGLGAGIAGGSNWGEGINKGWQNAMAGRTLDQQSTAENQTVAALTKRGIDADTARAAARNPTMLRAVLGQGYGPPTRLPSLQSNARPGSSFYRR